MAESHLVSVDTVKPKMLSPADAARYLGIDDDILARAMARYYRKGEIPGRKVGGRLVFDPKDLDNLREDQ